MGIAKAEPSNTQSTRTHHLLTFSASNEDSLRRAVQEHEKYLQSHPECIQDLSYTLNVRREHLSHRAFSIVQAGSETEPLQTSRFEKVGEQFDLIYVFTGQGAQWAQMGAILFESNAVFRQSVEYMQGSLDKCPDPPSWSLRGKVNPSKFIDRVGLTFPKMNY